MTYEEKRSSGSGSTSKLPHWRRVKNWMRWNSAVQRPNTSRRFYSPVPGGAGDGQALPRSVERIIDAIQAANAQIVECQAIRKEIVEALGQPMDIPDYEKMPAAAVSRRPEIGSIAAKMGMDVSWVYRQHREL